MKAQKIINYIRATSLIIIILACLIYKISYDNKIINSLGSEVTSANERAASLSIELETVKSENKQLENKIYDLELGYPSKRINLYELLEEILGFNYKDFDNVDKSGWYYYNTLGDYEKEEYKRMMIALIEFNTISDFDSKTSEEIIYLYKTIIADHPTLFWVNNAKYYYDKNIEKNRFIGEYDKEVYINTDLELYNRWNKIKDYKEKVFSNLNEFMTDEEKELIIFNYIVKHTEYETGSFNNQSLYSVASGKSVCAGYSKMFKYLCDEAGIKCICIIGNNKTTLGNHMWNMVRIKDENVMVDCTNALRNIKELEFIDYHYFNFGKDYMNERYIIDSKYSIPEIKE